MQSQVRNLHPSFPQLTLNWTRLTVRHLGGHIELSLSLAQKASSSKGLSEMMRSQLLFRAAASGQVEAIKALLKTTPETPSTMGMLSDSGPCFSESSCALLYLTVTMQEAIIILLLTMTSR